jgi:hypothetical protein
MYNEKDFDNKDKPEEENKFLPITKNNVVTA